MVFTRVTLWDGGAEAGMFCLQRCSHLRHLAIHAVMRHLGQFELTGRVRYQVTHVDHVISCCMHSVIRSFDTHTLPRKKVLEYKNVL